MDFNDKKFGGSDDRDRTVPPEENYYGGYEPDFNSRAEYGRQESKSGRAEDTAYAFDDVFSGRNEEQLPRRERPASKKKRKKNKFAPVIAILAILLALVIFVSSFGFSVLGKIGYHEKTANSYINASELLSSSEVTNVLLIGVDAREGESGEKTRSDTMLLISVDSANNCIKMTSFLRDSWVYIPCIDKKAKLNASCQHGGYSGVVDTIEYNFGIDIDGYVVTDFELFTVMVDSIGGVEIEVTEAEAKEVTSHKGTYGGVVLESGTNLLTGEQALAYCRIRKIGTDWGRTQRQRTVMEAIIKKALKAGPITAFSTFGSAAPYIETDLSKAELMALGIKAIGSFSGGFEQASCPFDGTWNYDTIKGSSVITLNLEKNKEELAKFIYGE